MVLDNPTTLQFWVRDVGQMLRDNADQYLFISTLSVYDTAGQTEIHEDSPRLEYPDGDPLAVTPEAYQDPVRIVDVRDLMEWTVRLAEEGITGTFNGTGPKATLTMAEQLHGIRVGLDPEKERRVLLAWRNPPKSSAG